MQIVMNFSEPTAGNNEPKKKKRSKKVNYDTTYCFSLSTSLLEALSQHASFNRKSISKVIREAITNELNSGRD